MQLISEQVRAYQATPDEFFAPEYRISETAAQDTAQKILAELNFGEEAAAIQNLQQITAEKGIKNALKILEKLNDPHIADDFHRYLVRYVAAGLSVAGVTENMPRFQALHMMLYEVALPGPKSEEQNARAKSLKELISAMEQFYAGLLSVEGAAHNEPPYFALELAIPANSPELQFYVAVPDSKRNLFEKQLLAIFPDAYLVPQPSDYNIFAPGGVSLASVAHFAENPALPLKDYADFDYDPINTITNAFAKIEHAGEGAALQIIVEPRAERHVKHYRKILSALR